MSARACESVARRKLVLLVEDNIDALEIYGSSLREAGYYVVEAPSAEDASAAVRALCPDLVVLDCKLPDGHGLVLLEGWRKARGAMSSVPVIVLTASVDREDVDAALLAGADRFVPKPCAGNVLARHVMSALESSGSAARLRSVKP